MCETLRLVELGVETSEGHETSSWHRVMIQLYMARETWFRHICKTLPGGRHDSKWGVIVTLC